MGVEHDKLDVDWEQAAAAAAERHHYLYQSPFITPMGSLRLYL